MNENILELIQLRQAVEEQKKVIEKKTHTIENLNREIVKCKTEYELLEKTNKEIKEELKTITKIIEDAQVMVESKDRYIEALEKEKKRLTIFNIGLFTAMLVLMAIVVSLSLKSV